MTVAQDTVAAAIAWMLVPASGVDASGPVDALLKWGPAGLVVILFVFGWIIPKPSMDRAEREVEYLKKALADERAAAAAEREAHRLELAGGIAAATEAARTAVHLLTELRQTSNVPEARR